MDNPKVVAEHIQILLQDLKISPDNLSMFKVIVTVALDYGIMTENEFANEFELGGLVRVWTLDGGYANPHPRMRKLVFDFILKKCESILRQ